MSEWSNAASINPFGWVRVEPYQLQNQLLELANYQRPTPAFLAQKCRDSACQWFAQHYRQRASKSGVFVVAKQLRKQGVPLDVAVSILATR